MTPSQPIACSLTSPELRQRLDHLRTTLFAETRALQEDASGFTFRFENTDAHVDALMEVVRLERQCCPFLHFQIDIAPEPATLSLHLGGADGARAFILSTFVPLTRVPGDGQNIANDRPEGFL